jgi:hypothetical protein
MVDVKGFLFRNRKIIIMLGLVIGAIGILDLLPIELPIAGTYTRYVYLAIIVAAAYMFYTSYWSRGTPKYKRQIPARTLSNPRFRKEMKRQMGGYDQTVKRPKVPNQVAPPTPGPRSPTKNIFDKFNRED